MPHKNCITMVLTKMRNDLKRPKTTCNDDLQWARNDLKRPTTNKTQPAMTWAYLQRAKKDVKRPTTNNFSDYLTIWDKRSSPQTRFPPNICCNHSSIASTENHGENRASNLSKLSCVFYTGYKIYFFLSGFRFKNIHKSQDSRERERLFF